MTSITQIIRFGSDTLSEQRWFVLFFLLTILSLFLYSFTQVDLSLTMSRVSGAQTLQKSFQYIGYFDRPLSAFLFLGVVGLMIATYLLIIRKILRQTISKKAVWTLIIVMAGILTFSYNAFSYDVFNYIFDAKILTHYQQNPYLHKALDFPADPMLSFMRWTHRTYPYGPVWLFLTVPFSLLGFNYFLITFFLFKIGITSSFLLMLYFISKIVRRFTPERELLTLGLIAFHPLLIIEFLVSGHNDSVMMLFVFIGIYFIIKGNRVAGFVSTLFSVGIKFATVFLIPSFVFLLYGQRKKFEGVWNQFFLFSGCLMIFACLVASDQTNFQSWYITWALPFFLMLPFNGFAKASQVVGAVAGAMVLSYVPFLYSGDYNNSIPTNFFLILWGAVALFYLGIFLKIFIKERRV